MASHVVSKSAGTRVTYGLVEEAGDVFLTIDEGRGAMKALRFRANGKFSRLRNVDVDAIAKLDDGRWAIPA